MWGILSPGAEPGRLQKGPQAAAAARAEADYVTPAWERAHPLRVLALDALYVILLSVVVYDFSLPATRLSHQNAIRRALEQTPFATRNVVCAPILDICSAFPPENVPATKVARYQDIQTVEDVFNWLFNVAATYHQLAFVGNLNQVYTSTLQYVVSAGANFWCTV